MDTNSVIDKWFADSIQGTEVGRHEGCYNTVFKAVQNLKVILSPGADKKSAGEGVSKKAEPKAEA